MVVGSTRWHELWLGCALHRVCWNAAGSGGHRAHVLGRVSETCGSPGPFGFMTFVLISYFAFLSMQYLIGNPAADSSC